MTDRLHLVINGSDATVDDDGSSLLRVLRDQLGLISVKDGCAPQGQCGCCTVLVDGQPRVSCVTPARRVRGRSVVTLEGLPASDRQRWSESFAATGASQCGFCTPGIIMRFAGLEAKEKAADRDAAGRALQAHLCRCTGWVPIVHAWETAVADPTVAPRRDLDGRDDAAAGLRATIEGGSIQRVGPSVALGLGGFADDHAPEDALVAVPVGEGEFVLADTLVEAVEAAGRVQGRRTTRDAVPPLELPEGSWARTLRTSWVEPAYLETDASWCVPGGDPATPLANGGAFGAKLASVVGPAAKELADIHGRSVRVVFSREDAVRFGPKRPPMAAGIAEDGSGVIRVAETPGVGESIGLVTGGTGGRIRIEEVPVAGPPTSSDLRASGWAEAAVLLSSLDGGPAVEIVDPRSDGWARVEIDADGAVEATVRAGQILDATVLHSYVIGAVHMGLGWVTSEGLAVDPDGEIQDLTIRSFGVLRAIDVPEITVTLVPDDREPCRGSDAVFAATAAAMWGAQGYPPDWPTGRLPHVPR